MEILRNMHRGRQKRDRYYYRYLPVIATVWLLAAAGYGQQPSCPRQQFRENLPVGGYQMPITVSYWSNARDSRVLLEFQNTLGKPISFVQAWLQFAIPDDRAAIDMIVGGGPLEKVDWDSPITEMIGNGGISNYFEIDLAPNKLWKLAGASPLILRSCPKQMEIEFARFGFADGTMLEKGEWHQPAFPPVSVGGDWFQDSSLINGDFNAVAILDDSGKILAIEALEESDRNRAAWLNKHVKDWRVSPRPAGAKLPLHVVVNDAPYPNILMKPLPPMTHPLPPIFAVLDVLRAGDSYWEVYLAGSRAHGDSPPKK